ncbi:MAG: ribosomal-processing cysteine protease Prp [Selenomonadaceae bacterium]|nr:ribosomal-processing cysteine protease Prp [Selenomonadaceae bacterium]
MIKATIYRDDKKRITGFTVSGHSGTAKRGEDIVCAAVSALTETALLGLGEYLHRDLDYSVASGKLKMRLKDAPDDSTEAILETMLIGLKKVTEVASAALKIHIANED